MGDIKVLLREAVPVEETEPDLAVVVERVRRRRRRRVTSRLVAGVITIALVVGATAGQKILHRDRGDDLMIVTGQDDDPPVDSPDASAFADLLAGRRWLATADLEWPLQPSDFLAGPAEPGIVVIGRLMQVRPGPVTTSLCMNVPDCVAQTTVETVIHVEGVAPGAQAHPDQMVIPWVTEQFTRADEVADQATSDRLAMPFEEVAPIGARVLLFLRPGDDESYEWRPVEPSGIVIEDPDGVAIPQPDPSAPDLTRTFDDYIAELGTLTADR